MNDKYRVRLITRGLVTNPPCYGAFTSDGRYIYGTSHHILAMCMVYLDSMMRYGEPHYCVDGSVA